MSLEPSFYSLYRRGRYSRSDEDETMGSRQARRELFAVAAVAFVLKHDEEFRVHFLNEICGRTASATPPIPGIEVQPHEHSDLAIKDEANSSLFIIEFKVGAELQKKQNPKHEAAFFGSGGYGRLILEEKDYQRFGRKTYVVLDEGEAFDDGTRQGLNWRSRTWTELVRETTLSEGLWGDLLDSLGELGVAAFQFQKLRNMNNAQYTRQAVAMHQTLLAVATTLKLRGSGGEDINWVQAKGDSMGWFGYQSGPGHCERAVWFYCGSDDAAKHTLQFMRERLGRLYDRLDSKGTEVFCQSEGQAGFGDAEWFQSVFNALADKNPPKAK